MHGMATRVHSALARGVRVYEVHVERVVFVAYSSRTTCCTGLDFIVHAHSHLTVDLSCYRNKIFDES